MPNSSSNTPTRFPEHANSLPLPPLGTMSINQPPTAGGSSDIIEPVQNVHSRPEFVDHTLQPADTLTDADEDHRDVKRESSVTAASDSSRRPVEHATASFGHDGKKHRRSLVDILSFGLLADPWRKRPWGAKWRSSSFFITFVVSAGIATDLLTYVSYLAHLTVLPFYYRLSVVLFLETLCHLLILVAL